MTFSLRMSTLGSCTGSNQPRFVRDLFQSLVHNDTIAVVPGISTNKTTLSNHGNLETGTLPTLETATQPENIATEGKESKLLNELADRIVLYFVFDDD